MDVSAIATGSIPLPQGLQAEVDPAAAPDDAAGLQLHDEVGGPHGADTPASRAAAAGPAREAGNGGPGGPGMPGGPADAYGPSTGLPGGGLGMAAQLAGQLTVMGALLEGLRQESSQVAAREQASSALGSPLATTAGAAPASPLQTAQAQSASAQLTARPPSPMAGEAHADSDARQAMVNQPQGQVDPGVQATPATLSSMQVEASWLWSVLYPGALPQQGQQMVWPEAPQARAGDEIARAPAEPKTAAHDDEEEAEPTEEGDDEAQDDAGEEAEDARAATSASQTEPWSATLERELRRQLAAPEPPAALQEAAAQWQRGRCVVLACPQGDDPWGPAWVFVLWPRLRGAAQGLRNASQALPFTLRGERLPAQLAWWTSPAETRGGKPGGPWEGTDGAADPAGAAVDPFEPAGSLDSQGSHGLGGPDGSATHATPGASHGPGDTHEQAQGPHGTPHPGTAPRWWLVRTVKEHHPQRGRQLHSLPPGLGDAPDAPVELELQLGPVLSRRPRWRVACVRVAAARRFWAALATQWSVHLLLCDRPLLPTPYPIQEVKEC